MARRTDHSRKEVYDMALAAARQIVEEEGMRALTARRVASAIGYSAGTLYNIFENLDDLVVHVNGATLDALHDRLADRGRSSSSPEEAVKRMLDRYLAFFDRHRNLCELLIDHAYPEGYALPDWYVRKLDRVMALLGDALAPIFANDERDTALEAARVLWASLHGICSLAQGGKLAILGAGSRADMARFLTGHFIAGLRSRAAT